MSKLLEYNIYLTDYQKKKIKTCYNNKAKCTLRLDLTKKPNIIIKLNNIQIGNIDNAKLIKKKKKKQQLDLNHSQIGGILPLLALLGTALDTGALSGIGTCAGKKNNGKNKWRRHTITWEIR